MLGTLIYFLDCKYLPLVRYRKDARCLYFNDIVIVQSLGEKSPI